MKFLLPFLFLLLTNVSEAQKTKKPLADSTQIKNTIISFYKWYNAKWQKVNAFKLYKGKQKKDTPPYVIDWREVEKYFSYLRKNVPYLSEAFFEEERKRFKAIEKDFNDNPEEEMPSGFDYDHFTNSQEEPSYFLQELLRKDNEWLINMQDKRTFLSIAQPYSEKQHWATHYTFFCAEMKKEKGKWKIGRLDCDITIDEPTQKEPQ